MAPIAAMAAAGADRQDHRAEVRDDDAQALALQAFRREDRDLMANSKIATIPIKNAGVA
jgi:hypothetical protein